MMWELSQLNAHKQRLITGLILGAVLFITLSIGPFWSWCLLVGIAATVGLWEFQRLLFDAPLTTSWQIFYLAAGLLLPVGAALEGSAGLHCGFFVAFFIGLVAFLLSSPNDPKVMHYLARFVLGWFYVPYLLSYVLLLGAAENGRLWLFLVLVIILPGDTGAFYGGRRWGRHKLYEQVSPKKTIEGSIVGLFAGILSAVCFSTFFSIGLSAPESALCGLVLGMIGQMGDLVESMFKRISGKKDSSNLLPGHGGLLDRLDSLLPAFPGAWFLHLWFIH
jgi:phosphatidate cytidylyltransferase